ncbi:MAG: VOC family protein [Candidatus Fermentibacteraceae bacterium]
MTGFDSIITFGYTRNMEETHLFYNGLLKLPMVLDQGRCRIYRVSPGGFIGFCEGTRPDPENSVMITLVTDDVDGWFGRVSSEGHTVIKAPAMNPEFKIYHCFVKDPSGYTVEIQRFEDPRWKRG